MQLQRLGVPIVIHITLRRGSLPILCLKSEKKRVGRPMLTRVAQYEKLSIHNITAAKCRCPAVFDQFWSCASQFLVDYSDVLSSAPQFNSQWTPGTQTGGLPNLRYISSPVKRHSSP